MTRVELRDALRRKAAEPHLPLSARDLLVRAASAVDDLIDIEAPLRQPETTNGVNGADFIDHVEAVLARSA